MGRHNKTFFEPLHVPEISRRALDSGDRERPRVLAEVNALAARAGTSISFCIGQPDFRPRGQRVQEAASADQ